MRRAVNLDEGPVQPFDLDAIEVYEERRAVELSFLTICLLCVAAGVAIALVFMEV